MLKHLTIDVPFVKQAVRLIEALRIDVNCIESFDVKIRDKPHRRGHSVIPGVPHFLTSTGEFKPMAVVFPNDAIASVPLIVKDVVGNPHAADTKNVSVTVLDPTIASAAITSDGQWVQLTALVVKGGSSVTYRDADDNITTTFDFEITEPSPASVTVDEAHVVLSVNPNPPTATVPAAGGTDTTGGAGGGAGTGPATTGGAAAGTSTTGGAAG